MAFKRLLKVRIAPGATPSAADFNRFQDNISEAVDQVLNKDILDQNLVRNVALIPSGINYVSHGLGRRYISYIATNLRPAIGQTGFFHVATASGTDAWPAPTGSHLSPQLTLQLVATATGTADIIVF